MSESAPGGEDQSRELARLLAAMQSAGRNDPARRSEDEKFDAGVAKLPGKGEWIKAAPGVAFACGAMVLVSFVVVFGVLSFVGKPTDQLFRLVNLFLNALGGIATLATLAVAMTAARRMVTARQVALKTQRATMAVGAEVHQAASAAGRAAEALNGDFEARLRRALGPMIEQAVRDAHRSGCGDGDGDSRDDRPPGEGSD